MGKALIPHVIRQGEHLVKLAFVHGFNADEVWNDPKNKALRELRKDPMVLAPGDVLHIPAPAKQGLPMSAGTTNRYTAKVPRVDVHIVLHDDAGAPLANEPYVIEGLGGDQEKTTAADGAASFAAPVHVREVMLYLPRRHMRMAVRVGDLDPMDESTGVAARLTNLGYLEAGEEPSAEAVAAAIKELQRAKGLPQTGALDDDTKKALEEAHGR